MVELHLGHLTNFATLRKISAVSKLMEKITPVHSLQETLEELNKWWKTE